MTRDFPRAADPESPEVQVPLDRDGRWEAELSLRFERRGPRTALTECRHRGPLMVQRPFYPEDRVAHVYLLHPPGGLVGGDRLRIRSCSLEGAEALLTTPAAGKCYRSAGAAARQSVELQVAGQAAMEWLPQETILFDGAKFESDLRIELSARARFIGWEMLCLGRPAIGEGFDSGSASFRLQIWKEDRPVLLECFRADRRFLNGGWGLRGNPVLASLFAHPFPLGRLRAVQEMIAAHSVLFGATLLDDWLVVRGLGPQVESSRRLLTELWRLIRPDVLGREPSMPRIWAT